MGREPSEKTQLANARRENKRLDTELRASRSMTEHFRLRATKAEQETAEWKRRFDELLKLRVDVSAGEKGG